MAKKSSFAPTLRCVLTLIAMAIRLWARLDWKQNSSFLSHKTTLEKSLLSMDLFLAKLRSSWNHIPAKIVRKNKKWTSR